MNNNQWKNKKLYCKKCKEQVNSSDHKCKQNENKKQNK